MSRRLVLASLLLLACGKKKAAPDDPAATGSGSGSGSGSAGATAAPLPKGTRAALRGPRKGDAPFAPSTQGFNFQNYGNEDGVENLTIAELQRLFGAQVCAEGEGPTCVLTPPAAKWLEETNKGMDGGHCEGMASVALLLELGKLKAADFGAPTAFELKLAGNKSLQHEIAMWFSTQFIAPMSEAEIKTLTPNEVADKLAAAFATGTESYTLGFYMPDGSEGHATTPYAIVDKSDTETWIMHYDNNFPGEERHIAIDRKANSWKYFGAADPKEEGATYEGDAETKSLTIAPTSVRLGKLECPFCGDIDTDGGAGGKGSRYREVILDGDADLLITDDTGKRTGHTDGKLVNEIPGAQVVKVKSGHRAATREPIYDVPTGHALTVTLDGSALKSKAPSDVSLIAAGYTMGVYGVALAPGEKDEIHFSADWQSISYKTDRDETPELELGIETSGADYAFDISAGGEAGGQRIDMTLDVKAGTLTVQASAKDGSATYEVEIHRIDKAGEQVFKHKGVSSGAADRLVFHYADWKGNGTTMKAGVDKGGDGTIDATEDLGDED